MAVLRRRRKTDGRMSLGDHLRELRRRFVVAAIAIAVGSVLGWVRYDWLFDQIMAPLRELAKERHGLVNINFGGITQPFTVQLQVALFVGVIVASPVWLYQVWGFIVPGLTKREKRTTRFFVAAAVPLFLGGCLLATQVVRKAVEVLLGFTPQGAANLPDAALYLTFVTRFILAFGLAFLLPVFLVGLNVAHILPARIMLKGWRIAVILIFVFSAMMTPTPDAWTMLALAVPMIGLFYAAVGIATLLDRRRARHDPDWGKLSDDEASPLDQKAGPLDEPAGPLTDDEASPL
ncbi:MAG: sec-independent protein translocase protein TatC [Actinomycetota bacterium]|nr:sec-independent protein translocase protein TatC [Actinomycetota bacterium]